MASSSVPVRKKKPRAESTSSRMSAADLANLSDRFPWIKNYETQLPASHQRPSNPPTGFFTIFCSHVERGFRLPLPKMLADILSYFDIAVSQLHPNGWLDMALDCYLASNLGVAYNVRIFRALHKPSKRKSESYLTFAKFGVYSPFYHKMSNVHSWDESFFYVRIKEDEPLDFPLVWNSRPLHMAGDMRILTLGDEAVADLMKQIKADAWTYEDALAFMMSDVPLIRRVEDQFVYSKITQFDQETRRQFREEEARKKNQEAIPQTDTGKRPMETTADPPLKKRRPNTVGSTKIMADAIKSAKTTEKTVQTVKPSTGESWSAKFAGRTFEDESLLNNLDEALGQVGEVQRGYDQIPGSIHVQKGKSELLSLYARLRTLENGLLQNVADRATVEKLEKELANANSSFAIANANLASANANLASATAALIL
ncbi:uncharacterized protein [Euphorbia lathyris]|uniref:uncharacterized protein n=1 Tax=Euphorbia lathyris TaxID=212925 RepID=UPI0033142945